MLYVETKRFALALFLSVSAFYLVFSAVAILARQANLPYVLPVLVPIMFLALGLSWVGFSLGFFLFKYNKVRTAVVAEIKSVGKQKNKIKTILKVILKRHREKGVLLVLGLGLLAVGFLLVFGKLSVFTLANPYYLLLPLMGSFLLVGLACLCNSWALRHFDSLDKKGKTLFKKIGCIFIVGFTLMAFLGYVYYFSVPLDVLDFNHMLMVILGLSGLALSGLLIKAYKNYKASYVIFHYVEKKGEISNKIKTFRINLKNYDLKVRRIARKFAFDINKCVWGDSYRKEPQEKFQWLKLKLSKLFKNRNAVLDDAVVGSSGVGVEVDDNEDQLWVFAPLEKLKEENGEHRLLLKEDSVEVFNFLSSNSLVNEFNVYVDDINTQDETDAKKENIFIKQTGYIIKQTGYNVYKLSTTQL